MPISHALRHHSFGEPASVLQLETIEHPEPASRQVLVKMLLAVINPSDFGQLNGSYGKLRTLPAVAGREGVGEIVAIGPNVSEFKVGDRVRFPEQAGAWQTFAVANVDELIGVPADVPLEMAAMAWINPPTAWRLLRDSHLGLGDWVIQNAANSAVGLFVIQLAKHLGLHTVNVVRREELLSPLKKLGGDVVVLDNDDYPKKIKELTGGSIIRLGLNSIGGESGIRLIKSLGEGGRMVTFGGMAFEPVRWPTRYLIFNDISCTGFWMDRWLRLHSKQRAQIMFDKLFKLMSEGHVFAPVEATYPLSKFKEAIAHAQQPKLGKVLLRGSVD